MKISVFVVVLLMVGVVLFVMVQMVKEAEELYDIEINKTGWEGKYDFASDINDSIQPIKESIDDIADEEKGWLEKVGAGFTGIIAAVTFLPTLVWNTGKLGGELITGLGGSLGIPGYLILVFIIMLTAWGIFKLIEFLQRWEI